MNTFAKLVLTAAAFTALPASAAVTIGGFTLDSGTFGGQNGVHSTGSQGPSPTITGIVNQEGSGVLFSTTSGNLSITGGGLATIQGDPLIENLKVQFEHAWDKVTFAFAGDTGSFGLTVNGTALFAGAACNNFCNYDGSNTQFTLNGAGINTLAFTFTPGISSAKQFRVDGVSAVPEPAAWGMMLVGFGAIGSAMRRRRVMRPSFV